MTDDKILGDLKIHMRPIIRKHLNINLHTFETTNTDHYKSSYYPFVIKHFENSKKELIYKYFCFECSLIEKEIETIINKKIKFNFVRYFNQDTNEYKLIIILINSHEKIEYSKCLIPIEFKYIMVPNLLENKSIEKLINENLGMTMEEFNNTKLEFLPIRHRNTKNIKHDKIFAVSCFFIELYLNKNIHDIKKYLANYERMLLTDFKNDTENDTKNFKIKGYKKILCCNLVNAPDIFIKLLPLEFLNVKIMIINNINFEKDNDFSLGEHRFENDLITINKINSQHTFFNYLFHHEHNELEVTFNENKIPNEKYEVKEIGDTIICKIVKFHKFTGYDADLSNKKILKLHHNLSHYKKIKFQKIHLIL